MVDILRIVKLLFNVVSGPRLLNRHQPKPSSSYDAEEATISLLSSNFAVPLVLNRVV